MATGHHQSSDLKKDFDGSLKGNCFFLEGHKLTMPPTASEKQLSGKLDIIHRYLVLQLYLQSGDPFACELQVRDKNNVRLAC